MKVEIFDTALRDRPGTCYFDLKKEIKQLQEKYEIKDIKTIMTYPDRLNVIVAIFYEDLGEIRQEKFSWASSQKDINEFLASHDVIKAEHFTNEDSDIITVITYRKRSDDNDD